MNLQSINDDDGFSKELQEKIFEPFNKAIKEAKIVPEGLEDKMKVIEACESMTIIDEESVS